MPPKLLYVVTVPQSFVLLRGQATYMKAHGLDVCGVSSPGPWVQVFESEEQVSVTLIDMPRRISPFADLVAISKLVRLFRTAQPQIVHAHTPKGGLLGMIAAWIARVPVRVYHIHGLPLETSTGIRRVLLALSERVSNALAHRVFAVSIEVRQKSIDAGLVDAEKVSVPENGSINGVDAKREYAPVASDLQLRATRRAQWSIPAQAQVIAFVGRIVRDKGVADLFAAWRRIRVECPDAILLLAGPEEPRDPVPTAVLDALRGDKRVRMLGLVERPRDVYVAADLVVLPTYREGLPGVPLEAAAMALPVVITNATGCREAVEDGETGLVVPVGDVDALSRAIQLYVNDPTLRALHGQNGRKRALEKFSPERLWRAHLLAYVDLLQSRAPDAAMQLISVQPVDVSG